MQAITRFIIIVISALTLITTTYAQTRVIPKVGVNLSAVDAQLEDLEAEARTGWQAGIDIRKGTGVFYFQPGLHYSSFTTKLQDHGFNPEAVPLRGESMVQSLRLPVNVGVNILGFRAQGGLTGTYVLGVKDVEGDPLDFGIEDLQRFSYGANVGVGLDLLFLSLDLNYEIGMSDFFREAAGRNNVLSLTAGIKF